MQYFNPRRLLRQGLLLVLFALLLLLLDDGPGPVAMALRHPRVPGGWRLGDWG